MKLPEERFWKKVKKTRTCWNWTAGAFKQGYGSFKDKGFDWKAHRWIYQHIVGPIPDGLYVLHKCDNRLCVRPDHLFLGTHDDNMKDMAVKGRAADTSKTKNGRAKLTFEKVSEIRKLKATGVSGHELSRRFGVCETNIRFILNRETWQ